MTAIALVDAGQESEPAYPCDCWCWCGNAVANADDVCQSCSDGEHEQPETGGDA